MGRYFGTDGFRGEANIVLTSGAAYKIGRFLGWYLSKEGRPARIVIGKDTRRSGYMLEYGLAAGITASGADTYLLHVTTTPSVSYMVRTKGFDCGIMISASHNPFYDNGIKLIGPDGGKMSAEIEEMIEEYLDTGVPKIPHARREAIGKNIDYYEGREEYIDYVAGIPSMPLKKFRIALDCANGSTWMLGGKLYEKLGLEPLIINNQPNGLNINENCGSTHIGVLQKFVVENGCDCGFAFDGDADRCLAVDHEGNVVDGDRIMFLCGKYLKEKGRLNGDTVVTTIMSNMGLYISLEKNGMLSEKTNVGDKYVAEKMFANDYSLGGEQSGHIIFKEHAHTGDGLITSLMVLEAMTAKNMSLKDLADECLILPQVLKNIVVNSKPETKRHPAVIAAVEKAQTELGDTGRILVRESGTEPKIRVMVEAPTLELCEKYVDSVIDVIRENQLDAID